MAISNSFDFKNFGEVTEPLESIHAGDLFNMIGAMRGYGIISGCAITRSVNQVTIASGTIYVGGTVVAFGGGSHTVDDAGMSSGQHRWTTLSINSSGTLSATVGTADNTDMVIIKPFISDQLNICSILKVHGSNIIDENVVPMSLDLSNSYINNLNANNDIVANGNIIATSIGDATETGAVQLISDFAFAAKENYTEGEYVGLITSYTPDNNGARTKAGLYTRNTASGTELHLGVTNLYGVGINKSVYLDHDGIFYFNGLSSNADINLTGTSGINLNTDDLQIDTDGTNGYIKSASRIYFEVPSSTSRGHIDNAGWDFNSNNLINIGYIDGSMGIGTTGNRWEFSGDGAYFRYNTSETDHINIQMDSNAAINGLVVRQNATPLASIVRFEKTGGSPAFEIDLNDRVTFTSPGSSVTTSLNSTGYLVFSGGGQQDALQMGNNKITQVDALEIGDGKIHADLTEGVIFPATTGFSSVVMNIIDDEGDFQIGTSDTADHRLEIINHNTGTFNLWVEGDISGATIGGITEANLLDKTANEVITGNWDFGVSGTDIITDHYGILNIYPDSDQSANGKFVFTDATGVVGRVSPTLAFYSVNPVTDEGNFASITHYLDDDVAGNIGFDFTARRTTDVAFVNSTPFQFSVYDVTNGAKNWMVLDPLFGGTSTFTVGISGQTMNSTFYGKMGINEASPNTSLHITHANAGDGTVLDGSILLESTNATIGENAFMIKNVDTGSDYWMIGTNQSAHLDFTYGSTFNNANTRMRMQNDGNIGIGTISPGSYMVYITRDQASMTSDTPLVQIESTGTDVATKGDLLWLKSHRGSGTIDTELFKATTTDGDIFSISNDGNVEISGRGSSSKTLTLRNYTADTNTELEIHNVETDTGAAWAYIDFLSQDSQGSTTYHVGVNRDHEGGEFQIRPSGTDVNAFGINNSGDVKSRGGIFLLEGNVLFFENDSDPDNYARMNYRDETDGSLYKYISDDGVNQEWREKWYDGSSYHAIRVDSGGFVIDDNLDITGNLDLTGYVSRTFTAGTGGVDVGDVCYLNTSGEMVRADADLSTTKNMLAIALGTAAASATTSFCLFGIVTVDGGGSFTVGSPVYVSETAGDASQSLPTGTGNIVRVIGHATSTTQIFFNPSNSWVELA